MAQWKADVVVYENSVLPAWHIQCTSIDVEWAAAKQLGTKGRRPPYPLRPKRPLKLRDGRDHGYLGDGGVPTVSGSGEVEDYEDQSEGESEVESEAGELLDSINLLTI